MNHLIQKLFIFKIFIFVMRNLPCVLACKENHGPPCNFVKIGVASFQPPCVFSYLFYAACWYWATGGGWVRHQQEEMSREDERVAGVWWPPASDWLRPHPSIQPLSPSLFLRPGAASLLYGLRGGHTSSHGRLTRILVRLMAKRVDVVATLSCPRGPPVCPTGAALPVAYSGPCGFGVCVFF